jgi:hypothetical protein
MNDRKKVLIDHKQINHEINNQPDFFILQKGSEKELAERTVKNIESGLRSLLNIHTKTSNCCPDITRRLQNTITYVSDIEVT